MVEDIYDPLDEYVNTFAPRFRQVAKDTFAQLSKEAGVDINANRQTCKQLYKAQGDLKSVKSKLCWTIFLCVVMWGGAIGGGIAIYNMYDSFEPWEIVLIAIGIATALLLLFWKIQPLIKRLKSERNGLIEKTTKLEKEAWQQMAPLNRLYDWDILTRMMTQTVPKLEFDPYFTTQRLADLQEVYGWDGTFNQERSVIYSHSGLINGNPFILCRTRKMEMGTKTYYGHKTIYWTTRERGSDGKMHTVRHSETLTASVTAPYPGYYEKTRLIYGNTAAPDLKFYRKQSGLANCEGSLSYRWQRRKLRKKSRDLTNNDFAMMTNEEFEVAFDTSNRNSNQQYALLFTPLAQANMLKLLKDNSASYGDDFDFEKNCMINTILPDHIQSIDLDMNPHQYQNFDYDKAEKDFYDINAQYFRAIYFCFAPLLCVPMYQQIRSQENIYGRNMQRHSAFWEHEALANFWGQDHFKHPQCVTDCILKTKKEQTSGDSSSVTVYAYGYRVEQRISYITKWGGDGRTHKVPVYWDEYLPVTGKRRMDIAEDNHYDDAKANQHQRIAHVTEVLKDSGMDVYRRHIVSKLQ
mgnify:FL=1